MDTNHRHSKWQRRSRQFLYYASFLLFMQPLTAQDIHFSQFYNTPLNLSPAKTGVFDGDQRLSAGYRSQWSSVPVPWRTFTAAYDKKLIGKNCYCGIPGEGIALKDLTCTNHSYFAGGILFNFDKASSLSDMTLSNINLTGSYNRYLSPRSLISFGAMIGYAGRGFDENTLTWDKQWNDSQFFFDQSINSTENFDADRVNYFETALGVNYLWRKNNRTSLDIGVGVYHLTTPGVGFYNNDDISLPARWTFSGVGTFQLAEKLDLQLHGLAQFQMPYTEYIIGGLGKLYLKDDCGKNIQLHLGLGYRTTKSLFPIIAVQYNNIYGAISYDLDLTDFGDGKDARLNALELHFRYNISQPKRALRVCPDDKL